MSGSLIAGGFVFFYLLSKAGQSLMDRQDEDKQQVHSDNL